MLYDPKWAPPPAEIELKPWQQLLLDAAALIDKVGWCQGTAVNHQGQLCAAGAMYYSNKVVYLHGDLSVYNEARNHFLDTIKDHNVPTWNDAPGRTQEEVVAAMRKAAQGS
jgi:hypothetical protein